MDIFSSRRGEIALVVHIMRKSDEAKRQEREEEAEEEEGKGEEEEEECARAERSPSVARSVNDC